MRIEDTARGVLGDSAPASPERDTCERCSEYVEDCMCRTGPRFPRAAKCASNRVSSATPTADAVARARGLAEAIALAAEQADLAGVRNVAAEIVELLAPAPTSDVNEAGSSHMRQVDVSLAPTSEEERDG